MPKAVRQIFFVLIYFAVFPILLSYFSFIRGSTPNEALVLSLWLFSVFYNFLPIPFELFILKRKSLDWFSPVLWNLLQSIGSVTATLKIVNGGWEGYWITGEEEFVPLLTKYFLLDILAKSVFYLAYYSSLGKKMTGFLPKFERKWNGKKVRIAVLICLVIGVLGYLAIAMQSGGISGLLNNMAFRRDTMKGQTHFFLLALAIPISLWCYWAYLLKKKQFKLFPILLMVFGFLLFLTLGGRGAAAQILLGGVVIYHYLYKRVKISFLLPIAFIGYTALLIVGVVRVNTYKYGKFDLSPFLDPQVYIDVHTDPHSNESGQGIERTMKVLKGVPEKIPYQYFTTYQSLVTTLIPRSIYPEKRGLSEAAVYAPLFGNNTDGKFGMYPAGSLGDFWLQAGVFGIMIGYFMQGLLQRSVYESMKRRPSLAMVVFYVITLTGGFMKLRNLAMFQTMLKYMIFIPFHFFVSKKK